MFMRTTQRRHNDTVEHVWVSWPLLQIHPLLTSAPQRTLADQGLIYKDTYDGYYSTTDECFYPASRVALNPTQLGTKISTETGLVVEWSSEVNYKLRLSAFREALLAH